MLGSEVGGSNCGREGELDIPISSPKFRFDASDSGSRERGVEGSPPGSPGWERRLTTSEPSSGTMGSAQAPESRPRESRRWRLASRSCSWRGICSELLNRGALTEFSGRSAVDVEAVFVCDALTVSTAPVVQVYGLSQWSQRWS
jgi:hypothetical protein